MTKTVNICDVCNEIFAGGDAPKNNMSQAPNERHSIPIFSNGEENEGLYGYTDKARVTQPSITVSARGTIGYTAIRNTPFVPIVRLITLIPNPELIDINYLYYAVRNYKFDGSGTSIPQLTVPSIKKYSFPLPTKEEQKRIALLLDNLCELIEKRKKQLAKLDELVKARFVEMFGDPETNPKGWRRQRFDALCDNLDSRRVPITSTERKAGKYPYYGASGIVDYVDDYIFDEELLLISEDGANLVMRSSPIAFSISGKAWVNNHAHVVRFASMATQKYIEICFALTDISASITGTAQHKLNQAKLNAMLFCVPPIELQEQFAAFVEQIDKSKVAVQKALDEAQTLFNSLMQQYFG